MLQPISLGHLFPANTEQIHIFQTFLNFWSNAPQCRHLGGGGGMCMLFKICEKRRFRNVWVGPRIIKPNLSAWSMFDSL